MEGSGRISKQLYMTPEPKSVSVPNEPSGSLDYSYLKKWKKIMIISLPSKSIGLTP
jgi:hypothetical protein